MLLISFFAHPTFTVYDPDILPVVTQFVRQNSCLQNEYLQLRNSSEEAIINNPNLSRRNLDIYIIQLTGCTENDLIAYFPLTYPLLHRTFFLADFLTLINDVLEELNTNQHDF